jgi:hypothetical protein
VADNTVERIGFAPNSGRASDELAIKDSPEKLAIAREWLQRQGLPFKAVKSALPGSVASAYVNKRYLNSWRTRLNPQWALLSGDDDGNASDLGSEASAGSQTLPPASKPVPTSAELAAQTQATASPGQTEAWLKDLFAQITRTVNTLTDEKIRNAKLSLDDTAREAIRTLAREAAERKIAELAKPQVVEVHDKTSGQIVALGLQHERLPTLLKAVTARDHRGYRLNIWLTGPTGSGKTSGAEAVARALFAGKQADVELLTQFGLTAKDMETIALKGSATENLSPTHFGSDGSLDADYKIVGFKDGHGTFHWTTFLKCFAFGYPYCADEIDNWLPSALLSLNAALANGFIATPAGMIQRHKDFVCIACANTWGLGATSDYVGRTKLDAASLDRFQPKIEWGYDEKLERALAETMAGPEGLAWHDTVSATRKKVAAQGLKIIISPRATFNGISLLQAGFAYSEVVDMTLAAGLSKEQKQAIGLNTAFSDKRNVA